MKKHIYDESNGLSYTLHGDYYLPDLAVNEEELTYGKYGMLRKQFPSRSGDQRAGGNLGKTDGGKTGCDGTTENAGSDEMGWIDE